jgi:hypothetical protein
MRTFNKYKQNLRVVNYDGSDYIMSYTTRVAKIDYFKGEALQLGWWSVTTQKHINYAADELGLSVNRNGN